MVTLNVCTRTELSRQRISIFIDNRIHTKLYGKIDTPQTNIWTASISLRSRRQTSSTLDSLLCLTICGRILLQVVVLRRCSDAVPTSSLDCGRVFDGACSCFHGTTALKAQLDDFVIEDGPLLLAVTVRKTGQPFAVGHEVQVLRIRTRIVLHLALVI